MAAAAVAPAIPVGAPDAATLLPHWRLLGGTPRGRLALRREGHLPPLLRAATLSSRDGPTSGDALSSAALQSQCLRVLAAAAQDADNAIALGDLHGHAALLRLLSAPKMAASPRATWHDDGDDGDDDDPAMVAAQVIDTVTAALPPGFVFPLA